MELFQQSILFCAEELLNCISSAAATAQKASPVIRKPRVVPKPQVSRFYNQDPVQMVPTKKRKHVVAQESNLGAVALLVMSNSETSLSYDDFSPADHTIILGSSDARLKTFSMASSEKAPTLFEEQ